jgi:hypothetical protein
MTTLGWIGCALVLSACSKSLDCASEEAKRLIMDIAGPTLGKPYSSDEMKVEVDYSLSDIRTESIDEKLKNVTCAASINMRSYVTKYNEYGHNERPDLELMWWIELCRAEGISVPLNKRTVCGKRRQITYKLEKTSEGKLYATVYGLH